MIRLLPLPLLILSAVLPFVESLVAQPPARPPRKVALLVGPKEYLHDFATLPHLDDDVTALAAAAPHPWKLCDMSGNVYQWCENKYSNDSASRVLRRGSWYGYPVICRAARRLVNAPANRSSIVGFRVCVVLD